MPEPEEASGVTFPVISQVDLPSLIDGVMHGRILPETIAFTKTPLVQSAGGVLSKLPGGDFYLVMGHSFNGSYTAFEGHEEHNAATVSQDYLNEIRKLKIVSGPNGGLAVTSGVALLVLCFFATWSAAIGPFLRLLGCQGCSLGP